MDSGNFSVATGHEKLSGTMKAMKEHLQNPSEGSLQRLLRDLNYLESSGDFAVFDMSTILGAQFQMDLHDLLVRVESTSPLLWKVISLLQKACTHSNGVSHLTLSYRYIPLIGKLLSESLTHEKELRLLSLLQTFTYGISIQWQEPYLKPMLKNLCARVQSPDAKEACLALSSIVNLLHRNPAAACAFLRCVSPKEFLKQLINNRDTKSLEFRLEVWKFLILTADITECSVDDKELKKFIDMTFQTIIECVHRGNLSMIRHSVNFFKDVTLIDKLKPNLLAYPSYDSHVSSVLKLLEDVEMKWECRVLLLQFLTTLVCLQPPKISVVTERIAEVASKMLHLGEATPRAAALTLLVSLAQKSSQQSTPESKAVIQQLHSILPVLVEMIKQALPRKEAITLLQLLSELTNATTVKKAIIAALDPNMLRGLLEPIIGEWLQIEGPLPVEEATLCVETLRLISKFSSQDASWLQVFSALVEQRGIQMALATALKLSPPTVKAHVLSLPTVVGFPDRSISGLAYCFSEVETSVGEGNSSSVHSTEMLPSLQEAVPLFGIAEQNRLKNILSRLEKSDSKPPLSELMSVFEYRIAEDAREVKILNSSLTVANNRIAYLLQRVDTSKEESVRLRRCLFNAYQNLEQTKVERDRALASAEEAKAETKDATREMEEVRRQFELKLRELEKTNSQLQKLIEEKNAEIQKQAVLIRNQKVEIEGLEETNRANMRQLVEKDQEIKEKDTQIHQLEIIKNAIYEISSGTKKLEK